LHGSSLLWNGGGVLQLELGATSNDEMILSGALTKGTAGTFTIDLLDEGITGAETSYTLLMFASTTFSLTNFTLELPTGVTGTLVETSTSLSITNVQDTAGGSELPVEHGELSLGNEGSDGGSPVVAAPSESLSTSGFSEPGSLTIVPTPEPGGATLLLLGGGTLLGWLRRRRK
jgi:hypothetical protein